MSVPDGNNYAKHYSAIAVIAASQQAVFDHLDDHERLASHMTQPSGMMAGARFSFSMDSTKGKAVGSRIAMSGKVLGFNLFVAETVVERDPPSRKVWQTEPEPKLLLIGNYRMGFEVSPRKAGSLLCVFIDYDLPPIPIATVLAPLTSFYARWCVNRMAADAEHHFNHRTHGSPKK